MRMTYTGYGVALLVLAGALPALGVAGRSASEQPFYQAEFVAPLDYRHNHSSCVVVLPGGDLYACWYRGSGERQADDVLVLGARKRKGVAAWSEPEVIADTPGFPDCNPCMVVDPQRRLWLFWPTIMANEWHTALARYKVSREYRRPGPPVWHQETILPIKPGPEFAQIVAASVERDLTRLDRLPEAPRERARAYLEQRRTHAADKYFVRMGWMPRAHPFILDGQRLIVPLYSDGFDFSLMAITDDWGETWHTSAPLVSDGGVQPSIARRRDGTLVAYFRDNGPPPQRLLASESRDRGETWTEPYDTDVPNPGSGAEVVGLRSGRWALIYNDTEEGRHRLAVSISEDEGKTWRWTRHLENDPSPTGAGSFSYPSLVEATDGSLHATYSYSAGAREVRQDSQGRRLGETIKHAHFNEAWVREGDR
jgi:predicted neuraminidase